MSMKKIQTNIFICIIVFISESANAGSYEDGIVAYSRRDYQTASKLFRNGADRRDSKAQYKLSIMYDQYCPVNLRGIGEKANSGAAFRMTKGVSDLN